MSDTEFKTEQAKITDVIASLETATAEAKHDDLTVVAWVKKHSAQIVGGFVFVSTLVAVALLTHR